MDPSQRYFIQLAYKGTHYHGWQVQPNAVTIQQVLNQALSTVLREDIHVVGAGRTDAGVHASCYWAHFDYSGKLEEPGHIIFRLNRFLPDDIAIYGLYEVPPNAHARYDALSRTYQYQITTIKDPFKREYAYHLFWEVDMEGMNEAAKVLYRYQDFSSFSKSNTQNKTNLCEVYRAEWQRAGHMLIFTIQANRFLRNMVRAIVGTLLETGRGRLSPEGMQKIIESRNRSQAGYSVPANGLFLTHIQYPAHMNLKPYGRKTVH